MLQDRGLAATIRLAARPLTGDLKDYDPLIERAGGCQFVLIGDAGGS